MTFSKEAPFSREDFYTNVYSVVKACPVGRVTTYGAIANFLGTKGGARMVGYALNAVHNQDMNDVPAHRVVNRKGLLTGKHHFPSPNAMAERLAKEGIAVVEDQVQNFAQHFWDPAKSLDFHAFFVIRVIS
jgi:methylated-DNA-protein-cysteine methyltransferase-like protein